MEPSFGRRVSGTMTSLVPGVIVHGTGHWVERRPCTARRLAVTEAVGAGAFVIGGSTIALTGASRYLMLPAISLTVVGVGLFVTSFAADVYGSSGAASVAGEPLLRRPRW
ncbi:MAG TPA: hypothetical protein VIV60_33035, partial [Polyangiaceae bacterium]